MKDINPLFIVITSFNPGRRISGFFVKNW